MGCVRVNTRARYSYALLALRGPQFEQSGTTSMHAENHFLVAMGLDEGCRSFS